MLRGKLPDSGQRDADMQEPEKTDNKISRRRFLSRQRILSENDWLVWLRGLATPLKRSSEYVPAYAWA